MVSIIRKFCGSLCNNCCCETSSEPSEEIGMQNIEASNPALPESYSSSSSSALGTNREEVCEKETARQNRQALRIMRYWANDSFDETEYTPSSSGSPTSFSEWKPFPQFAEAEMPQFLLRTGGEATQREERGEIIFPKPKFIKPLP